MIHGSLARSVNVAMREVNFRSLFVYLFEITFVPYKSYDLRLFKFL